MSQAECAGSHDDFNVGVGGIHCLIASQEDKHSRSNLNVDLLGHAFTSFLRHGKIDKRPRVVSFFSRLRRRARPAIRILHC